MHLPPLSITHVPVVVQFPVLFCFLNTGFQLCRYNINGPWMVSICRAFSVQVSTPESVGSQLRMDKQRVHKSNDSHSVAYYYPSL
jgi:hypothetical protein